MRLSMEVLLLVPVYSIAVLENRGAVRTIDFYFSNDYICGAIVYFIYFYQLQLGAHYPVF